MRVSAGKGLGDKIGKNLQKALAVYRLAYMHRMARCL